MPQSDIGHFVIGESPIGASEGLDPILTIISQYQNSPTLYQLIINFSDYINPSANLSNFFDFIWNVDTAQGYGLDVWGRIVGVQRTLEVPTVGAEYFGFSEPVDPYITGFGQARFYGTGSLVSNYTMTDTEYRLVILAKALANITQGSARAVNAILRSLFPGRGRAYVQDNLDMTITYVFDFVPTPVEIATIAQSGVLPRPTGVSTSFVHP